MSLIQQKIVNGCFYNLSLLYKSLTYKLSDANIHTPDKYRKSSRKQRRIEGLIRMSQDPIVWIDCEMTGLDIGTDHLIEVAILITDGDLNILAEGPDLVIHQTEETMNNMGDWCKEQHKKSGLTTEVLESKTTTSEASSQILDFLKKHVPQKGSAPLAGNSVHADKMFLKKEMPEVIDWLHYRIIDVSSVKELCKRWHPVTFANMPAKKLSHRALDDIKESIEELKFYRKNIFIAEADPANKRRKED